jgi:hypothetical protein
MADLPESPDWAPGVYQLETSDPVLGGPEGITNLPAKQLVSRTRWLKMKVESFIDGTQSVGKTVKLVTARTISISGAAIGRISFDGSANAEIPLTLKNSGVTAGTFTKVQVDAKGIVTAGSNPTQLADHGIAFASQREAEAGADTNKPMSALRVFQAIAAKVVQATASVPGIAGIATQIMVKAGTDNRTIVTPETLAAMFPFRGRVVYEKPGVYTWDVPSGVTKAWVVVIGAGGGGAKSAFFPGPFGGAGGGIAKKLINLMGIKSVTVTVGTGGVGATDNGVGGTDGGTSSFGVYMYATGGAGGMINSSIPTAGRGFGGDENHSIESIGHMLGPVNVAAYNEGAGKGGGAGFVSNDYRKPKTPGYGGNGYGGRPGRSTDGADGQATIQW